MKIEAVLAMHDRPIGPRVEWDGTSQITLPVGDEECDRVLLLADGVPFLWVGVEWSPSAVKLGVTVRVPVALTPLGGYSTEQGFIRPCATLHADGEITLRHGVLNRLSQRAKVPCAECSGTTEPVECTDGRRILCRPCYERAGIVSVLPADQPRGALRWVVTSALAANGMKAGDTVELGLGFAIARECVQKDISDRLRKRGLAFLFIDSGKTWLVTKPASGEFATISGNASSTADVAALKRAAEAQPMVILEEEWFSRNLYAESGRIAKEALETPIDELVRHGQDVYRARELEKMTTISPQAFKQLEPHPISPEYAARASEFFRANQIGPTAKNVHIDFPGRADAAVAEAEGYDAWRAKQSVRTAFKPGKNLITDDYGAEVQIWVDTDGEVVCKCCGSTLGLKVYCTSGLCQSCYNWFNGARLGDTCEACTWQAKGPRPALEGAAIVGTEQPVRFVPVNPDTRLMLGDQEITGFASGEYVEIRRRGAVAHSDGSGCEVAVPSRVANLAKLDESERDFFEGEREKVLRARFAVPAKCGCPPGTAVTYTNPDPSGPSKLICQICHLEWPAERGREVSPPSPFLSHVAYAGCDWFEKEMDFALSMEPKLDYSSPLYGVSCSCGASFGGVSETDIKKARAIAEKAAAERSAHAGLSDLFVHGAGNEPTSCASCGEFGHRPHCPEAK